MKFFADNRMILDPQIPTAHHGLTLDLIKQSGNLTISPVGEASPVLPHTMLEERAVIFIGKESRAYTDEILATFLNHVAYLSHVARIERTVSFLKQCYEKYNSMLILSNVGVIGYIGFYPLPETNFFVLEFIMNPAADIKNNAFNFLPGFMERTLSYNSKILTVGYNLDTKRFVVSMNTSVLKEPSPELIEALKAYYPDISRQTIYLHQ